MARKSQPPRADSVEVAAFRGEILVPYDPAAGEVTEVRNLVLQSSLAELKRHGHYDRYVKCIAAETLDDVTSRVAPGWVPVELALAHYQACEDMNLSNEELNVMG